MRDNQIWRRWARRTATDIISTTSREAVSYVNLSAREWETLLFHQDHLRGRVHSACRARSPWADSATRCLEHNRPPIHATGPSVALRYSGNIHLSWVLCLMTIYKFFQLQAVYNWTSSWRNLGSSSIEWSSLSLNCPVSNFLLLCRDSGSPTLEQVLLMGCQGRGNDAQGTASTESDLSMLSTSGMSSVESSLNELMVYLTLGLHLLEIFHFHLYLYLSGIELMPYLALTYPRLDVQ